MISCDQHDYIEIACMYRFPIKLTLESGEQIEGHAVDTQRNDSLEECIKITVDSIEKLVVLDNVIKMEALVDNPHFKEVSFKDDHS